MVNENMLLCRDNGVCSVDKQTKRHVSARCDIQVNTLTENEKFILRICMRSNALHVCFNDDIFSGKMSEQSEREDGWFMKIIPMQSLPTCFSLQSKPLV